MRHNRHLIICAAATLCASTAYADLVIFLAPTAEGGVQMSASGTSVGSFDGGGGGGDTASLFILADDILGGGNIVAPADFVFSGSLTIGADTVDVTSIAFDTTGDMDSMMFGLSGDVFSGQVTANDVLAAWSLDTLPFTSLTPGTYEGGIEGNHGDRHSGAGRDRDHRSGTALSPSSSQVAAPHAWRVTQRITAVESNSMG